MSVLPLRDEVPPSDASVAAERPGVAQREDGWQHNTMRQKLGQRGATQLHAVIQHGHVIPQVIKPSSKHCVTAGLNEAES